MPEFDSSENEGFFGCGCFFLSYFAHQIKATAKSGMA